MQRASYQNGSVIRKTRKLGPDVWVYRYTDAAGVRKAERVGTVTKYPTKAAATKRAGKMRDEINERTTCITVAGLCARYTADEMPDRMSTSASYRSYLKRFQAEWGKQRVDVVANDVMSVERWINAYMTLATVNRPPRPASKRTKQHMKAFVHRLFECALKWGYLTMQRNPIQLVDVKGRARRVRQMNLLTKDQWLSLVDDAELSPHVRTMIFIAMLLGLRASEILGLRWEDVDFEKGQLHVGRSYVGKSEDDTKTVESEQDVAIHDDLREVLIAWRAEEDPVNGWLFGNLVTGRPFWRDSLQADHLIPAGKKVGIPNLGWHDFRHTYRAMMDELEIPIEMQRTLMRHEDIKTTLGYGRKARPEKGRAANARVVEMLRKRA